MFKVIAKLYNNGVLVGLRCNIPVGTKNYDIKFVRENIDNFNIRVWGNGFRFRDSSIKFSNLPVINIEKNSSKGSSVTFYTGDKLKIFIDRFLSGIKYERSFVSSIKNYIRNSSSNKVVAISGLRGVGKTVGLLQVLRFINNYNDSVFINIDREISCEDLKSLIDSNFSNKKYIFIDEVTRVIDFLNSSSFLYDSYSSIGINVIISGTDSLGLIKSSASALYHRVFNISCTFISYPDANRTCNMSFDEYMKMGGLYKADSLTDFPELCDYIDTAIIDNIYNTLIRSNNASAISSLKALFNDRVKLRSIVFKVLYAVGYHSIQRVSSISVKREINIFDLLNNSYSDVNRIICDNLGIASDLSITQNEVILVLNVLQDLGVLYKLTNIANDSDVLYYITNPSMNNQIILSILRSLKGLGFSYKKGATLKSLKGSIFESIIVCHTINRAMKLGFETYFYRSRGEEIDLIVGNTIEDEFISKYICYEIKMTKDSDIAVVKSKWIMTDSIYEYLGVDDVIIKRGIIYGGDELKVFDKFTSEIEPPSNMTLEEIEKRNRGIKLFPVLKYLNNMSKIFSILK